MEGIGNTKGYYWYSNDICMFKIKNNGSGKLQIFFTRNIKKVIFVTFGRPECEENSHEMLQTKIKRNAPPKPSRGFNEAGRLYAITNLLLEY
jgi:hypothetical protein